LPRVVIRAGTRTGGEHFALGSDALFGVGHDSERDRSGLVAFR